MPDTPLMHRRIAEIQVLQTHIINYSKTRDTYVAYRKSGYSKKLLAEHEADISIHKAAKTAFDELGVKKLPTRKSLQAEYAELLTAKNLIMQVGHMLRFCYFLFYLLEWEM